MPKTSTNAPISRRAFVSAASAVTAFSIVPRHVLGGTGYTAPSETVTVGVVGIGGRGLQNARDLMKLDDVRIVAVADPAAHWDLSNFYYKGVAGRTPGAAEINRHTAEKSLTGTCSEYEDFRKMLEAEKSLDAVLCATPDHLHATVSIAAMRQGKHAYCEKPLTHNVAEARLVAKVAKETGLATQMGNQGHANEGIRQTVEWLRAGAIGPVRHVHAWVGATRWNPTLSGRPTETQPIPSGLNWDLWLGPREKTGFHSAYAPVSWRDFWDYGCGAMGDFGCHDLDSAVWALDLEAPESIEMLPAGQSNSQIAPYGEIGYFHFGARGDQPPVTIHWYSGGLRPERPDALPDGENLPGRGVLFVGDHGMMLCGGAGGAARILPESRAAEFTIPEPTIPRSNGHHRDWVDAIKGGPPASSHFEYGARLTEITLLGVASLRLQKRLEWDGAAMKATNAPEADAILHGTYRQGWELS